MDENQFIGQSFLGGLELEQELASRDVLIKLPILTSAALYAVWGWKKSHTILELRNLGSGEAAAFATGREPRAYLTELSALNIGWREKLSGLFG